MTILEVAVAAPLFSPLCYIYREEEGAAVEIESLVGCRALVPLGRRCVTAYILGKGEDEGGGYRLRPILQILDKSPLFFPSAIPFFKWVSTYYHYPLGEVIATALPGGLRRSMQKKIVVCHAEMKEPPSWPESEGKEPEWFVRLCQRGELSFAETKKVLQDKQAAKLVNHFCDAKRFEITQSLSRETTRSKTETCYALTFPVPPVQYTPECEKEEIAEFGRKISDQVGTLKFSELKALYCISGLSTKFQEDDITRKELLSWYSGAAGPLRALGEKKIITTSLRRIYRNPFGERQFRPAVKHQLSAEQEKAVGKINLAVEGRQYAPFLLHGVTGSGKTEVYLNAAQHCLNKGRGVIVLVPEIALATQLESNFVTRFGEDVVLLHSGLSPGERYDQWCLASSGKARVVIGARSAVFAPLDDPGLIIVDEEHDSGFKQDDRLRYNARDLAVLRGNLHGSVVLLGSATPSIVSYYHSLQGKYTLLTMEKRIPGANLPSVEIVDLGAGKIGRKRVLFHQKFRDYLQANLERNEQSLVLLNRRGFSASLLCQDCGASVQCTKCNVSLTYHKFKEELICHYCGYRVGSQLICGECHSDRLIPFGVGTERVEEELKENYPHARIVRLDSDIASDRRRFLAILQAMNNQEIDILIGTQMIAKGHHFPNVTFVGVVWADGGLNMPDFRAAERTFQLLSQVTGRAGRGKKPGKVLIQTMRPKHYAIAFAQQQDYRGFYDCEIGMRKRPAFPPFVRLVCFHLFGENEYDVRASANNAAAYIKKYAGTNHDCELLGPAPSPLGKINDLFRWQLLLKSDNVSRIHELCGVLLNGKTGVLKGKTELIVDRDPENMM